MGGKDPEVERTRAALKMMRQRAGLSQRQLERATGGALKSATLAQIETGRRLMSSEMATKAAPALGTDALSLLVASNAAAIKARMDRGEEGPVRARRLLVEIRDLLEGEELTPQQHRHLLDSAGVLATLLERAKGAGETPEDRLERIERASATQQRRRGPEANTLSERAEMNDALDRDYAGRRMPQEMERRRRAEKSDGEPNGEPEAATKQSRTARGGTISSEASAKAAARERQTINESTDRDPFGRRKGTR